MPRPVRALSLGLRRSPSSRARGRGVFAAAAGRFGVFGCSTAGTDERWDLGLSVCQTFDSFSPFKLTGKLGNLRTRVRRMFVFKADRVITRSSRSRSGYAA